MAQKPFHNDELSFVYIHELEFEIQLKCSKGTKSYFTLTSLAYFE